MSAVKLKLKSFALAALTAAYAVMWVGGVGHYALYGGPPLDAPWAASGFLLLAGLLVVITSRKKDLIRLFIAALLGFVAEIIGVRCGFIFSPYRYTEVLQPQLFDVPLVMFSAWLTLVAYCRQMLMNLKLPAPVETALAALWMTAIDLVIDPLAANQLGYWRWARSGAYYGIPLRNFIGWFVVSFIIFSGFRSVSQENQVARYVGLSIVLFFTAIALSFGLVLAGSIGLGLCLAHLALAEGRREGEKERQRDREIEGQRDRETEGQRD
ncbi:MAG: carotenoid biosynthesis protein [Blastocatellia bacterium]